MDESYDFEENPQRRSFALSARPKAPTPAAVIKQSKDHKKIYFFALTSLHALGVVYGDIGTSPLYVYRSIFENETPKKEDVEGVLCLIFYAITFVVTFKYLIFVMMADYKGQGGIFALLSLLLHRPSDSTPPVSSQFEERREPLSETEDGVQLPTLSPRELKIDIPSHDSNNHHSHGSQGSNDDDKPPSPLILPHSMSHGSISNLANLQPSEFLRKPAVISVYTTLSLIGASLLLGDGVITPAISVLSAIEGLNLIGGGFEKAVVPITCIILFALFMVQRFGTHKMGMMFGPIMILWFASLAALGIYQTSFHPAVFESLNPAKGIMFFVRRGEHGWRLLGSVVLSVTGCEAMFADMGHFGKNPVRFSWLVFVYPSLFLNYCGQAALLIRDPAAIEDPFFKSAPHGVFWPLLVLSTLATVIASQALISGAFSIVQQAISDDFMPRMKVIHTNDKIEGQIFIPALNYFLMIVCILLVISFQTSTKLGNAYGLAVCCDMMMTTVFFATLSRFRWRWNPIPWAILICSWLIVDGSFLSAALLKIPKGGWFPLAFTVVMSLMMVIWREGRTILGKRRAEAQLDFSTLMSEMKAGKYKRCRGTGIFLTPVAHGVPTAMSELLEHIPFLHRNVIFLTIEYLPVPRVEKNHVEIHEMELKGFYRIHARYGYRQAGFISMESLLKECEPLMPDVELKLNKVSFFLHREKVRVDKSKWIGHRILVRIFNLLMLVHHNAASGFGIPPTRVITLGAEVLE